MPDRTEVARAVFDLGSFSKKDIEKRLEGGSYFGGARTLKDYLEEMVELGILDYEDGIYTVDLSIGA